MKTYKGFNSDMICRGFQYEVGGEYVHEGDIKACSSGFHACENPLDVFSYYPPVTDNDISRYCEVDQSGELDKSENDKVCSSRIHILAEIGLKGLIEAGVKFILDRVKWYGDKAATNTGYRSAASVEGKESIAIVTGRDSRAKGALDCWLVLTERDSDYHILDVKAVKVDGRLIKPNTWYKLENSAIVEC